MPGSLCLKPLMPSPRHSRIPWPANSLAASISKTWDCGRKPHFRNWQQRSGIVELRIFSMAMLIQRQTGGNLSEVLDRLAGLIRSRLQLRKQVRAWTAEGRLQGWTLSGPAIPDVRRFDGYKPRICAGAFRSCFNAAGHRRTDCFGNALDSQDRQLRVLRRSCSTIRHWWE